MIVNLSNLNASNGMFWYAIDKIKTLGDVPMLVMVTPLLAPLVRRELPAAKLEEINKRDAALRILRQKLWCRSRERIVTFTSHPLPFVNDQTIAFYDDYPFAGPGGWIKRILFTIAARTSGCRIGIINRSLALPFLKRCGIDDERIFFDSAFPAVDLREAKERSPVPGSPLRIGLVGTDSLKKNYAAIFAATIALNRQEDVRFFLYGSENDYVRDLRLEFAAINLTVVPSDDIAPVAFFDGVDYLVSAAVAEGYGRPMGLAAALGVPLFLLRSPVFLEFFRDHAVFFDDIPEMMQHVINTRPRAVVDQRSALEATPIRSPYFA